MPPAGGWQKAFYTRPRGLTSPLLLSPETPSRTPRMNYPQKRWDNSVYVVGLCLLVCLSTPCPQRAARTRGSRIKSHTLHLSPPGAPTRFDLLTSRTVCHAASICSRAGPHLWGVAPPAPWRQGLLSVARPACPSCPLAPHPFCRATCPLRMLPPSAAACTEVQVQPLGGRERRVHRGQPSTEVKPQGLPT